MPKKTPEPEATGGRERRGYVQMNIRVPEDLRRRFRAAAILEGREMSEIVEEAIREYLDRERKEPR